MNAAQLRQQLRDSIGSGSTIVAPGCHDALSALLVEAAGFPAVYVSGFATEGATLGRPDIGFMDKTDYLRAGRNVAAAVDIPVICDIEQGFGNAVHLADTIQQFEATGVAGVHLDDEIPPGKCPFIPDAPPARLISTREMQLRIERACESRTDPNFLVIARCDMAATTSPKSSEELALTDDLFEDYLQRLTAYAKAGADVVFIMPQTVEQLAEIVDRVPAKTLSVLNPWLHLTVADMERAGVSVVITSMPLLFSAAKAMADALEVLKSTGSVDALRPNMIDPADYWALMKIPAISAMYARYAIGEQ